MTTLLGLLVALAGAVGLYRYRDRVPAPDLSPTGGGQSEIPLTTKAPKLPDPPPRVDTTPGPVGTGARGIRNHNPGNIKYSVLNSWLGQIGSDGVFIKFSSPTYGIRAIAKLLVNYQRMYGKDTIRKLITRWSETDQTAYVDFVAKSVGISPDQPITLVKGTELLRRLVTAIIRFENGQQPYSIITINTGISML